MRARIPVISPQPARGFTLGTHAAERNTKGACHAARARRGRRGNELRVRDLALVASATVLVAAPVAVGHSGVRATSPKAGSVVRVLPAKVTITFRDRLLRVTRVRVLDARNVTEISLGDFVLSGGEPAALALIDACVRLLPGVMGGQASLDEESFTRGLLEYPHYTRPADWCGRNVPDVLLSGHHENICAWRTEQAEIATRERRPDLWDRYRQDLKNQKEHSHERD